MFTKKIFVTVILLTALASGLTSGARALDKATIMLDWYPNPVHIPMYLAQAKGYFAEQGLEVDILVPADPNDPLKLVAAGKMDFAISYQPSVLMARDRDLPVVSLGALVQHPLSTILYLKESGIEKTADFKGRKIGYSVEPLYRVLFEAVAEKAGLKKEDYELFRVGYNLSPPLLTGKIDGAVGAFRNYEAVQIELEGRPVGILPLEKHGIPDFYELVVIAHPEFIGKNPKKVKAFMTGLTKGIEQTLNDPQSSLGRPWLKHPIGKTRTTPSLAPFANTNWTSDALSTGGTVLGITHRVVKPPRAAAKVPVAIVSLCSKPGSLKWQWTSTIPGETIRPFASIVVAPPSAPICPTDATTPSLIRRSPTISLPLAGSMIRPPRMATDLFNCSPEP